MASFSCASTTRPGAAAWASLVVLCLARPVVGEESPGPDEVAAVEDGTATGGVEGVAADGAPGVDEDDDEARTSRYDWYALPTASYDTDDGFGFGARGELAVNEPGFEPYQMAFVLHAFGSLNGFQHHRFRFDRVGLGPGRRLRLTLRAAYRQWGNDGYWGIGNGTAREREFAGDFGADDPRRKRYRYQLYQPFVHLTLRAAMSERLSLFLSLNGKWTIVGVYEGSLLDEQRPSGVDGGLTVLLAAGMVYDSREPEVEPQRGVLAEASSQWAVPLPWGPGQFGGAFLSLRGYRAVTPWLVIAGRIMAEMLGGDVPFYEMVHWRGMTPITGFGGFETLRGLPFGRWRAPSKAIANLELRFRVIAHRLFRRELVWQLGLFGDAGIVWAAGEGATDVDDGFPIHAAGGAGIRLVYANSFVGRFDFALGNDPVREASGELSSDLSYGIYVVFDQAF